MKRLKYMFASAILLAALTCGGCKAKPSEAIPETTQPLSGTTQAAQTQTEEAVTSEAVTKDTAKPADGTTAASSPAGTTKASAGAEKTTDKKENPTKPAATTAKADKTTKKETTTLKPGAAVTTTKKAVSTTKSSGVTKPSGTTKPSGSTKPSGTTKPTNTTKPAPTIAQPVAKGNAVAGKITFLNDAKSDYVSNLTARSLEAFGITGDLQKQILSNPNGWKAYTIRVDFENKETMPVTLYYLNVPDNGKDSIYINGENMGELGMPVGGKVSQQYYVLTPVSVTEGFVLQKLHAMKMDIQYAATPNDDSVMPSFVYAAVN